MNRESKKFRLFEIPLSCPSLSSGFENLRDFNWKRTSGSFPRSHWEVAH
ncbi:hypothetical protein RISK_006239 [Rhodopirellula islandica]|uniref:Uncharacterized protein n=1 Tax=Rhodopirellula islandica TaxID=595434 RepID=A0A0J1B4E9_RHOIS|nr:hypothetical protein RISK_006239 [Rhodopirellula islandica]